MTASDDRPQHPVYGATCMVASVLCFTINILLLKHLSTRSEISPWVFLSFRAIVGIAIICTIFGRSGVVNFRRAATSRRLLDCHVTLGLRAATACFVVRVIWAASNDRGISALDSRSRWCVSNFVTRPNRNGRSSCWGSWASGTRFNLFILHRC